MLFDSNDHQWVYYADPVCLWVAVLPYQGGEYSETKDKDEEFS